EVAADPLPDVADHLAAAGGAVAGGEVVDGEAVAGAPVEVRPFGGRRVVAPGEAALATGRGVEGGGAFPLRLGGEAPAGPAAVGGGFVPVDMDHRQARLQ